MKKKIQESIIFILNEYKRLKKLNESGKLSAKEKITFKKLTAFLSKDLK